MALCFSDKRGIFGGEHSCSILGLKPFGINLWVLDSTFLNFISILAI